MLPNLAKVERLLVANTAAMEALAAATDRLASSVDAAADLTNRQTQADRAPE